ncbi:FtsW/RodA/SpoVE family cell cycle protein [Pseudobacillus badius]|uniref:FtsW/RodA/SpoVE family cell cycle protein n=1 Tax=Bacillus badius TaxID=1455 RepID=UPI0024A56B42|nr:FtsW/RodA/SpoVE family cell cycle protein [Bacillus badius]GLY12325.1 cell division protein FtsW [Bacillus badius]
MDKQAFIHQTIKHIRSKDVRQVVALELNQHIEKNRSHYMRQGLSKDEAEKEAIRQMGDPVKLGKKMKKVHKPKIEWGMIALFMAALCLGFFPLVVYDRSNPLLINKMAASLIGIAVLLGCMHADYRKLQKYNWLFYGMATFLLWIVFAKGFLSAVMVNGVYYLSLGPLKCDSTIVLPLYFLAWAGFLSGRPIKWWQAAILFVIPLYLFLEAISLVNMLMYGVMVLFMCIWALGKQPQALALLTGSVFASVMGTAYLLWPQLTDYQFERIRAFLHPEENYFYAQTQKIISEAGWLGKPIDPAQFYLSVPEAQTDSVLITAIYGLGWLFFLFVLLILLAFSVRMAWLTTKAKDSFGQLLLVGGFVLYTLPLILNLGMTLGWLPYMGVFVPFISYGTITVLLYSFLTGIVLSIYRRKDYLFTKKPLSR